MSEIKSSKLPPLNEKERSVLLDLIHQNESVLFGMDCKAEATGGGKPTPSLMPEWEKISAIYIDDKPILSGMESGFDSLEPISEPALLSLEESNLLHELELKETVVKRPEEKKCKVSKVVCASVVPTKEDLTCEVLKVEKDKLLAETAYYVQKTKELTAVEMVAIAKRIYYENLNQNQCQQNNYMNHHIL
uniref:Uncharacterized protein n=1 Tax=Romanomermis culicivorax TaxID=13658 RepID=A0A915LCA4_ROMCU